MTAPSNTATEIVLLEIARNHFFIETFNTKNIDWLDFHEVSVWSIRSALEAAFAASRVILPAEEIEIERPFTIRDLPSGDLEVVAIEVNHIVPTTGLLLRQAGVSIIFTSDTAPTERIWEVANSTDDLAAVITEVSFPNRLQDVADVSLHMTPQGLVGELAKLKKDVAVFLYHFKPPYVDELRTELAGSDLPHPVEAEAGGHPDRAGWPAPLHRPVGLGGDLD